MTWNDHDHRGEYADERHDHDLDYAEKHHRHYDLETDDKTAQQGITCLRDELAELRGELDAAYGVIRDLRHQFDAALAEIRVLDRLRPSCVICHDAAADRQTTRGPACSDCAGDLPDDGPDPDRPETWAFAEAQEDQAERAYLERRVIQAAVADGPAAREDATRTVAAARQEWRAASDEERPGLMRAAEESIDPFRPEAS